MLVLLSITALLTLQLPLSALHHTVDCSLVKCALPKCSHGEFIPVGKCCPVCKEKPGKCPPVKLVSSEICQVIKFAPCRDDNDCLGAGKCCHNGCGLACQRPVLDCSTLLCLKPDCEVTHVPQGKCCPVCGPDCSKVECPLIRCPFGSYIPEGKCCPTCEPDCSSVPCLEVGCLLGSYIPEGKCCPICNIDCSGVPCLKVGCLLGSYIPEGKCCPICNIVKPGVCPNVAGKIGICLNACSGDQTCPGDQKCCSNGCGKTCQAPALETCPYGQNGICGSIAGNICPDDTECKFKGSFPDAAGKCCIKKPKPITACTEPLKIGPCRAAIPRYFYNTTSCKCELFSWGGCQPNENNFYDLAYCQASCEVPMQSNPFCKLDKVSLFCKLNWNIGRWRFNKFSCKCELYKWNGCGNANNFASKDLCESNCGCFSCKVSTDLCDFPTKPEGGGSIVCHSFIPSYVYNIKHADAGF